MTLPEKLGTLSQVGHLRRRAVHLTGETSGAACGETNGEACGEAGDVSSEAGGNIRTLEETLSSVLGR